MLVSICLALFSSENIQAIINQEPIKINNHPHEIDFSSIHVSDCTSPFQAIVNRYPTIIIISKPKNRTHNHDLTVSKIHIIESNIKIIYAGIWRSVKGKGSALFKSLTTGEIMPVKRLTTPSSPMCIREKVINEYFENIY
jgi:hypothetical protein